MTDSVTINDIIQYSMCPTSLLAGRQHEQTPQEQVRSRVLKGINELTVRSLGRDCFEEGDMKRTARSVVRGFEYEGIEKDQEAALQLYRNLSGMLREFECTLTGSVIPVELAYARRPVSSWIDFTVRERATGRIYPCVLDTTTSSFKPYFSPRVYRAQTIVDYLELEGTNSEVMVLVPGVGKRWTYDHRRFGRLVRSSIESIVELIDHVHYARFGWWCATCRERGICYSMMGERITVNVV